MHVAAQHALNHLYVIVVPKHWHKGTGAKSLMVLWHFRLYLLTGCSYTSADILQIRRQHMRQLHYAVRWLYWIAFETS